MVAVSRARDRLGVTGQSGYADGKERKKGDEEERREQGEDFRGGWFWLFYFSLLPWA